MKIVIAGGTGLIGRRLAQTLLGEGHTVRLLTRSPRVRPDGYVGPALIPWDPPAPGLWMTEVQDADAIVNLAGESVGARRWTARQRSLVLSSRLHATRALAEALAAAGTRRRVLVSASAVGYYGHVAEGDVTEDHPPGDDFLARVCTAWEDAARSAGRHGVRVVIPRIGFVLAPEAPAFRKMLMPFRFFAGGWYSSGRQWFPWVHIDDVIGAIRAALAGEQHEGPFNVTGPESVRTKEFCRILAGVLRRPCWAPAPAPVLRAVLGEMADLLLKGQKAVPARLLASGYSFRFPSPAKALADVTVRPGSRGEAGAADEPPARR